jgi:anti-sigma factor RsiW
VSEHVVGGLRCSEVSDLAAGFVLGALEPTEMTAVRAHLAGCPEPHPEFAELGSVTPALLASVPQVEPPAALRDRILAAARAEAGTATKATDTMIATPARQPAPARPAAEPRRSVFDWLQLGSRGWAFAGVAAALVIAILGYQVVQLGAQNAELAAYQRGVAAVFDTAAKPGAQLAVLAGQAGTTGPTGVAAISSDGKVEIAIRGLTPTTGTQVYEAWAIAGKNAAPVPIGGFQVGSSGAGALDTTTASAPGVIFALTLEPQPGAQTPTPPILVSGAAQGAPS